MKHIAHPQVIIFVVREGVVGVDDDLLVEVGSLAVSLILVVVVPLLLEELHILQFLLGGLVVDLAFLRGNECTLR